MDLSLPDVIMLLSDERQLTCELLSAEPVSDTETVYDAVSCVVVNEYTV